MKENVKILIDKIKKAKSIAISGHKNPDGDSLCSALALMRLIELNFNKKPIVIYDGHVPMDLAKIPLRNDAIFHTHVPEDAHYDLYILVDYGIKKNLGGATKFVDAADFVVEFDHHYNEEPVGNLCFDNQDKAATSQIIYDVVRAAGWKTDESVISLLTLAIITDTGNFKFVHNSDVFQDAASLVDAGANMIDLVNILNNKDKKAVQAESRAVANAEFFMKGRLAIATINNDDYKKLDGRGEIVMRLLGEIRGVEFVVLLKEHKPDQVGVSFRSRSVPINQIAESFGGGGHLYAAGAIIMDTMDNVREKVKNAFKGM